MIEIKITQDIRERAQEKADEMGRLNNSIRQGEGNLVGFMGEQIVANYLNACVENTYDYDIMMHGAKLDVKTKECTSPPKPHYECSIAAYNTKQKCNAYVFTRICQDTCWILGWMPKEAYFKKAKFMQKGQIDPSNNFVVRADCYNLAIQDLKPIDHLKNLLENKNV